MALCGSCDAKQKGRTEWEDEISRASESSTFNGERCYSHKDWSG